MADELPVLHFKTTRSWETFLKKNHERSQGVWLRLGKKGAGLSSPTYAEALDVALCYGWIDGQRAGGDEQSWLQRFTPRRPKSIWSKINRTKVQALIEAGRMQPAGLKAIELAKGDGRWDQAYDSPKSAEVPDDLQRELDSDPHAKEFFQSLEKRNSYAILWRIQTAKKPETRARRIKEILEMLKRGEKFHP